MKIDLSAVFEQVGTKIPFDCTLDISDNDVGNFAELEKPVRIFGSVINHAGIVELHAEVQAEMLMKCARCAKQFHQDKCVPLFYVLSKTDNSDDENVLFVPENSLDLREVAVSAIILNMDMVTLCKPDCKGLCQFCGTDLNESVCACKSEEVDPRLAPLKKLYDNLNK